MSEEKIISNGNELRKLVDETKYIELYLSYDDMNPSWDKKTDKTIIFDPETRLIWTYIGSEIYANEAKSILNNYCNRGLRNWRIPTKIEALLYFSYEENGFYPKNGMWFIDDCLRYIEMDRLRWKYSGGYSGDITYVKANVFAVNDLLKNKSFDEIFNILIKNGLSYVQDRYSPHRLVKTDSIKGVLNKAGYDDTVIAKYITDAIKKIKTEMGASNISDEECLKLAMAQLRKDGLL